MARADLLLNLVRAGSRGDQTMFRRSLEAMVAEERAKHHGILANQLGEFLRATDEDLAALLPGEHVPRLYLGRTRITDRALAHIAKVDGLERLGLRVDPPPETNMVFFAVPDELGFLRATRARGLLVNPVKPGFFRAVTHLDVDAKDIDEALARIGEALAELRA